MGTWDKNEANAVTHSKWGKRVNVYELAIKIINSAIRESVGEAINLNLFCRIKRQNRKQTNVSNKVILR